MSRVIIWPKQYLATERNPAAKREGSSRLISGSFIITTFVSIYTKHDKTKPETCISVSNFYRNASE